MESHVSQKAMNKTVPVGLNGLKRSGIPMASTSRSKSNLAKTVDLKNKIKANNENMPPPKVKSTINKTEPKSASATSTITRRNIVTPRVAPKRPAITSTKVNDNKRSRVTPSATVPSEKPATKSADNILNLEKLIDRPKPNKWDLKGRVAYNSEELLLLKKKFTEISEKYEQVKKKLYNEKKDVEDFEFKVEKANCEIKGLAEESADFINKRMKELDEEIKTSSEKLIVLEELNKKTPIVLQETRNAHEVKEKELLNYTESIERLSERVNSQKERESQMLIKKEQQNALLHEKDRERRDLHNAIQDLKGKIRVFCRVRPLTEREQDRKMCTLNFMDDSTIEVARAEDTQESCGKIRTTRQEFTFDKVFPPSATQEQVFEELELLVQSALEGYNVCVFAYGQTGSGKTYTMEGNRNKETEGMIPRTVRHIFKEMKNFEMLGWQYTVEASILEIYNEHIVDLLDSEPKTHEIRMVDSKTNDLYVTNLHIEPIDSPEKLHECLMIAHQNRAVAATSANERSSRSHSVTRIRLIGKHAATKGICIGNLNLVDLAGSERLKNEEASRTVETKSINKSLSNLGNVILALLKKQDHIPYRNSKLTHILMPSLGGNSKTLMLLNISPMDDCFNETLNSLRFASTVNSCRTGNVKRQKTILQN